MSSPNFIQYLSCNGTDAMERDPFFAPDPQLAFAPSPDSFDREVDNDKEFEDFDLELSLNEFDDIFATFGYPIPVAPAPSVVTHSTESVYSSQYSCDSTTSDYSIPSEIEFRGSVYDGLYSPHASVYSAPFSDSLPSIPPPSSAKLVAVQESATTASLFAPAHVVPGKAHNVHGPVKSFKCPRHQCDFCKSEAKHFIIIGSFLLLASARKHNLKTHMLTHDREASRRFVCRHGTCKSRYTRKHDLQRHRDTVHKEQIPSSPSVSNASNISKRSFDPTSDQFDLSRHYITGTRNGDPTPMLSTYPDYDATMDIPEDIIALLMGVEVV